MPKVRTPSLVENTLTTGRGSLRLPDSLGTAQPEAW